MLVSVGLERAGAGGLGHRSVGRGLTPGAGMMELQGWAGVIVEPQRNNETAAGALARDNFNLADAEGLSPIVARAIILSTRGHMVVYCSCSTYAAIWTPP